MEYVFPAINQIQVNEQAGLTFATGLKSILRQDPDVILVGEIRDAETARIAVQSALTGHFVLSTLHGTDAVAALHRLLDMGIESFLIASSVWRSSSQRLVRRICDGLQGALHAHRRSSSPSTRRAAAAPTTGSSTAPAATYARAPATRTASASTSCSGSRRRSSASWWAGPPRRSSGAWPMAQGMRTAGTGGHRPRRRRRHHHRRSHPHRSTRSEGGTMPKFAYTAIALAGTPSPGCRTPTPSARSEPASTTATSTSVEAKEKRSHPPVRDHQGEAEEGRADALQPAARRLRAGGHPDPGGPPGHRRGVHQQGAAPGARGDHRRPQGWPDRSPMLPPSTPRRFPTSTSACSVRRS